MTESEVIERGRPGGKPGLDVTFWNVVIWAIIGLLAFLVLTVVALGVAWAFYLLIGLFP